MSLYGKWAWSKSLCFYMENVCKTLSNIIKHMVEYHQKPWSTIVKKHGQHSSRTWSKIVKNMVKQHCQTALKYMVKHRQHTCSKIMFCLPLVCHVFSIMCSTIHKYGRPPPILPTFWAYTTYLPTFRVCFVCVLLGLGLIIEYLYYEFDLRGS
jgi:hypothetical protein